jgi:hypothetical protein
VRFAQRRRSVTAGLDYRCRPGPFLWRIRYGRPPIGMIGPSFVGEVGFCPSGLGVAGDRVGVEASTATATAGARRSGPACAT